MKYTIISVDDSRQEFKDRIRAEMLNDEEFSVDVVDARPLDVNLKDELAKVGLHMAGYWKSFWWQRGDIGGYIGHYNAWKYIAEQDEPVMVFEDDAWLPDGFRGTVDLFMSEVPDDFGAVAFCVHPDTVAFYDMHIDYDEWGQPIARARQEGEQNQFDYGAEHMARSYQGWAMTATVYSPKGAASLVKTSQDMGLHMNADALVWHRAAVGDFDGYAPKPQYLYLCPEFYTGQSMIRGKYRGYST